MIMNGSFSNRLIDVALKLKKMNIYEKPTIKANNYNEIEFFKKI